MRAIRFLRVAIALALWLVLAADAVMVIHDFYTYADRAVYAAVDDGEANIAYSLATRGRYSFPASPVLTGMSRMQGQFNYGPWYFYVAAGFVWLFGYSLTVVRSIHLWVIVGCAVAATLWFRGGRDRAASGALVGFGALYFFGTTEWPMARPDSLVTAFAVVLTIAAGLGMLRRRPVYWFIAGLAAACGAFTHLVAASLVPSSIALFAGFAVDERRQTSDRNQAVSRIRICALALGAGLALGAAMFYASFGFDLATQWRFLTDYRNITSSSETYVAALMHHFGVAFGYYPAWLRQSVWLTLGTAWVMTAASFAWQPHTRRDVFTYVLPPAAVWTLYLLSNGKYTNYHQGYAILHHVMFLWTAAAIVWVACESVGRRRPAVAAVIGMIAAALVLALGVSQVKAHAASPVRGLQAEHRVAFTEYADRVLGAIPAGARAWGSVFFGIEAPDRVQLIQQDDAVTLLQRLDPAQRAEFTPDFLIWGYPEVRDDALAAMAGAPTRVAAVQQLLPDGHFRLASLVDGKPYGVTRVYARTIGLVDASHTVPAVAVYDDVHRHWLTRIGPALPIEFHSAPPLTLHIGYESAPAGRTASATVSAVVPPGHYWLKVSVRSGTGAAPRLLAVTSATMTRQTMSELSVRPAGDFAGYLPGTQDVFTLSTHPGGVLYVSQFDGTAGASIESVTIARVIDLLDPGERQSHSKPMPGFTHWIPMPGVQMVVAAGRLRVDGDASVTGYQLYSPVIAATPGELVEVDVPNSVARGQVCVGILNKAGRWVVTADEWREQIDFRADATGGFRVTFANCQFLGSPQASRFELAGASYARGSTTPYADRLTRVALDRVPPTAAAAPDPPAARFPEQPLILIKPTDLTYRAALVKGAAGAWTVDGRVDPADPFLMRARARFLDTETRVLVAGRLDRGGLSIGLIRNGEWAGRVNVTEPGEFAALLAPPANGPYEVAIATDAAAGPTVTVALNRVDLLPAMRPAK